VKPQPLGCVRRCGALGGASIAAFACGGCRENQPAPRLAHRFPFRWSVAALRGGLLPFGGRHVDHFAGGNRVARRKLNQRLRGLNALPQPRHQPFTEAEFGLDGGVDRFSVRHDLQHGCNGAGQCICCAVAYPLLTAGTVGGLHDSPHVRQCVVHAVIAVSRLIVAVGGVRRDGRIEHPREVHEGETLVLGHDGVVQLHHARREIRQLLADRGEALRGLRNRSLECLKRATGRGAEVIDGDRFGHCSEPPEIVELSRTQPFRPTAPNVPSSTKVVARTAQF